MKHSVQEFREFLENKGFKKLGSGLYSVVYAHPTNPDIAIKVGEPDPWPDYAVWATENGYAGKFAPLVHSLKSYKGNGHRDFYVAVMERLVDTIRGVREEYADHNQSRLHNPFNVDGWELKRDDSRPDLQDFMHQMSNAGYSGDLHDGNIMVRKDGEIVITDPVSGYHKSNARIRKGEVVQHNTANRWD